TVELQNVRRIQWRAKKENRCGSQSRAPAFLRQILFLEKIGALSGGLAENSGGEFFVERVGAGDAPGDFVDFHGSAEALQLLQFGQGGAGGGQGGVVALQVFVGRFTDDVAAAAREAFQAA